MTFAPASAYYGPHTGKGGNNRERTGSTPAFVLGLPAGRPCILRPLPTVQAQSPLGGPCVKTTRLPVFEHGPGPPRAPALLPRKANLLMSTSTLRKRVLIAGLVAFVAVIVPGLAWLSLTHEPTFYRPPGRELSLEIRWEAKAKHFYASSLQLAQQISATSRDWRAVFTDQESTTGSAEAPDHNTLPTRSSRRSIRPASPSGGSGSRRPPSSTEGGSAPGRNLGRCPGHGLFEDNVLELTFEKIRALVIPISARNGSSARSRSPGRRITESTSDRTCEDELPVATFRFGADHGRSDIVLERLSVRQGQIRLSWGADRLQGRLPSSLSAPIAGRFSSTSRKRNRQGRSSSPANQSSTDPTS